MIDVERMQHNARCAVKLLKAMSNETRMMILCELLRGERSVGQLEERILVSQSSLSQHLARLRRYTLVCTRRSGQTIYYSLNGTEVPVMIEALQQFGRHRSRANRFAQPFGLSFPPSPFDDGGATLDVAQFLQPLAQDLRAKVRRASAGASRKKETDSRHAGCLLCIGGERCSKKCPDADQEVPALNAVHALPSLERCGKSTLDRLLWVDCDCERPL